MNPELYLVLFHTLIVLGVCLYAFHSIINGRQSLKLVFFTFGMVGVLFSNLYWIAYVTLRPDTRMPFAANEFGEWAMFLLFGACLFVDGENEVKNNIPELAFAAFFALVNTAFWIGWSGEWIQDIITGIVFGYFLFALLVRWKNCIRLPGWAFGLIAVYFTAVLLMQGMTFWLKEYAAALDMLCHFLLFAGAGFLLLHVVSAMRRQEAGGRSLCLAFSYLACMITMLYMSDGYFYYISEILLMLFYPVILYSIKREGAVS